jgi:hydrogenase nickel incorporation protein HypA/HybF
VMHELSIAHNVVEYALSEAAKNGSKRVEEVDVEVGELTQVEPDVLSGSLAMLMTGPKLQGCRVVVTTAQARFECRKCSSQWGMAEVRKELDDVPDELRVQEPESRELPLHFLPQLYSSFIHCPRCGSADISALGGEDIRIRRLALE